MNMIETIVTILAMFVVIIFLDFLWLGIITKEFIIQQFGSLVKVENGSIVINLFIGLLTWLIIAIGVFVFAVLPSETIGKTALLGAAFGFFVYAIYDLTNLTFIVNYPLRFVFVDIAWGTILSTALAVTGFFVKNLF